MLERRNFPRLNFRVDFKYNILNKTRFKDEPAETKNLSEGGICIILLKKVDIGDKLNLKFYLPETNTAIKTTGRVVWTQEFTIGTIDTSTAYDVGIEFTDISQEDRHKINQYIIGQNKP
ncbi:MAG: PilZ domain-containing protein [Candidatus Omnitrophota bacterium]